MLTVADIMNVDVLSLSPTQSVFDARILMEKARIRHLPIVTRKNDLVGLVSLHDIFRASVSKLANLDHEEMSEIESAILLLEVMTTDIRSVTPTTLVSQAAALMLKHKVGCLPVLEENTIKGILTKSDFLALAITLLEKQTP